MGYEVKMYIVEPTSTGMAVKFIVEDSNAFEVFRTYSDTEDWVHYGADHNTETVVPKNSVLITKAWSKLIGMVDLGKVDVADSIKKETDYYFYSTDGNTPIILDRYDEPVKQVSLKDIIDWLEKQIANGSEYRRYKTALALAKSCLNDYNAPVVLLFGH